MHYLAHSASIFIKSMLDMRILVNLTFLDLFGENLTWKIKCYDSFEDLPIIECVEIDFSLFFHNWSSTGHFW